jgi:hypothetical protein
MADKLLEWIMDRVIPWIILATIAALFLTISILIYNAWQDSNRETFSLVKADWECTQGRTYTTMVLVGKILVPETRTECVQYTRH